MQLIPFRAERHLDLLRDWLQRPHVARWWGEAEAALAHIREHPPSQHRIVVVDGEPVGYVCWQGLGSEEARAAGLDALPADHVDVDIFIGEAAALGRGHGPRALRALVEELRAAGASSVGLATDEENRTARRAFAKAGFTPFRAFEEQGRQMRYLTMRLVSQRRST